MKTGVAVAMVAVAIVAVVVGLVAYSYTQIQISLDDMSFAGFDWNLSGFSIIKAAFDLTTGNLLGTILSVITGIKLNLLFGLSNHGIFPVYIPDLSYDLSVNDIKIGQGNSKVDLTINPGETKQLPILQDFTFSTLGPAAESVIASNGMMNVKVSGTAYFKFLGLSVPVPFESTKQVSVVDEAKKYIEGKISGQSGSYQPGIATRISLQASAYSVEQGQTVSFTGRLTDSGGNGMPDKLVYLKRDISLLPDTTLNSAYTDQNGQFTLTWVATKPLTSNNANIYAAFGGGPGYSSARSSDIQIQISAQQTQSQTVSPSYQPAPATSTGISIQASSYSVTQGQQVTFSGVLTESNGNGIPNQLVYVKRDISLAPDSVLGTAYTGSNGAFSVVWTATKPLTSNTANVYATFEGSTQYSSSRSSDISIQVTSYQPQVTQQQTAPPQTSQPYSIQTARFPIANSQYQVGPRTYTYIPFNMQCSGTVTGSFSAQAALGDNIIVYVMDSTGFRQFQSGGSAYSYYNSGKVASGTINIGLSSGQYYLILSNTYSTFSTKNVNLVASYTCS